MNGAMKKHSATNAPVFLFRMVRLIAQRDSVKCRRTRIVIFLSPRSSFDWLIIDSILNTGSRPLPG